MQVRPNFFVSSDFRPGGRNFKGRRVLAFLRKLAYLACAAVSFNYRRVKNLLYSKETFRLYEDTFEFAQACTS